jgi:hypothetical protein
VVLFGSGKDDVDKAGGRYKESPMETAWTRGGDRLVLLDVRKIRVDRGVYMESLLLTMSKFITTT